MWTGLDGIIRLERYTATIPSHAPRRIAYIEAGPGCPFACTFCATAPFWEQRFRVKPVDRIVEEIRYLHEEFAYDSFILVHDLLTVHAKFISAFCEAMIDARLPVEWMANSRTDIRLRGLLPKMKAVGCWKLFFGVESASPRVQAEIDKRLNIDEVFSTIEDLTDHGISATTSFVMGFAGEKDAELSASIGMGARLKLMGVETVKFHRLRLFPPSRLSRADISGHFDSASLAIEYPFIDLPDDDMQAIRGDPEFFAGYWTPPTPAGSPDQLAQVEMFFHHMVAFAPLTIAAAAYFGGPALIACFYDAVEDSGPIKRENLDWEKGDLFANWPELRALLNALIEKLMLDGWKTELVSALALYEGQRLAFVSGKEIKEALTREATWMAFCSNVDLPAVLDRLHAGTALTRELLRSTSVVLARKAGAEFAAYTGCG